jgi:hypothetical protein
VTSLSVKQKHNSKVTYLDSVFDYKIWHIWTADRNSPSLVWVFVFDRPVALIYNTGPGRISSVKAVRSIK